MSWVVGIDLSGPANLGGTVAVACAKMGESLKCQRVCEGASDQRIHELVDELALHGSVVIGIDAPLSYEPGGGDRSSDRELRLLVREAGLPTGTVITPTATRMCYLTLRGMAVARMMTAMGADVSVVEVHPSASMALRGASVESVRGFKRDEAAREDLLAWVEEQGVEGVRTFPNRSDHFVAACAAALAASKWSEKESVWLAGASPPLHPFDFCC